jgi:hypothetical protein
VEDGYAFNSSTGAAITATLIADPHSAPLSLLRLRSPDTTVQITYELGASHLQRQIESGSYKATSLAPADPSSPAELVALQLARGGKNSLYQKILPRFRAMLESR